MRDLDCQVGYWNTVGPTKPFNHPLNAARLAEWLSPDDRILDYGCGYGRVLGLLYEHGYRNVIGVDPAPAMIAEARRRLPMMTFEHCPDPFHLDLEAGGVGAVLLFSVLTCVPTDEGQRAIVREARRVLGPAGLLYVSDLWLQTDRRNVERYERDRGKYGRYGVFDLEEGVAVRHHDREWIAELTAEFDPVAVDDLELETMNGHRADGFQWFGLKRG